MRGREEGKGGREGKRDLVFACLCDGAPYLLLHAIETEELSVGPLYFLLCTFAPFSICKHSPHKSRREDGHPTGYEKDKQLLFDRPV